MTQIRRNDATGWLRKRKERLGSFAGLAMLSFTLGITTSAQTIIPQVADGGGWQTTFVITNTSASIGTADMLLFTETGTGGVTPWNLNFLENVNPASISVPPGSTVFLHTFGAGSTTAQGYASITATSNLVFYAIFTQRVTGRPDQDGTATGASSASRFLIPFDNTNGFVTTVAVVNSGSSGPISVAFRTSSSTIQAALQTLPAGGHLAFALPQQFSATGGQAGLAEFYSASGAFSILGLRFNPSGGLTVAPSYSQSGAPILVTNGNAQPLNVAGIWSGTATDSSGSSQFVWQLIQSGSNVNGTISASTPQGTVVFSGTYSGTIVGSTIPFTITIPVGGIPSQPQCSSSITGSVTTITSNSMSGTYSGTNTCSPPFTNGTFTLSR